MLTVSRRLDEVQDPVPSPTLASPPSDFDRWRSSLPFHPPPNPPSTSPPRPTRNRHRNHLKFGRCQQCRLRATPPAGEPPRRVAQEVEDRTARVEA